MVGFVFIPLYELPRETPSQLSIMITAVWDVKQRVSQIEADVSEEPAASIFSI
jgi:hypothetical protein